VSKSVTSNEIGASWREVIVSVVQSRIVWLDASSRTSSCWPIATLISAGN